MDFIAFFFFRDEAQRSYNNKGLQCLGCKAPFTARQRCRVVLSERYWPTVYRVDISVPLIATIKRSHI